MTKWKSLSNDLKVVYAIDYFIKKKSEKVWFSKLAEFLEKLKDGSVSKSTVSRCLDRLFDLGIVDGNWEKLDNGKWGKCLYISGEAEGFVSQLSKNTEVPNEFEL